MGLRFGGGLGFELVSMFRERFYLKLKHHPLILNLLFHKK